MLVPFYAVFKIDALSAEDVQRASNRQIYPATAELFDFCQVIQRLSPSGISHW